MSTLRQARVEEQWLEENDEDYYEEKKNIADLPYDKFLKEYSKWNDEGELDDEPKYYYLGKDIIDRIKEEDLPLFVNVDWHSDEIAKRYNIHVTVNQEALCPRNERQCITGSPDSPWKNTSSPA
jgi:hypothetical protein